MTALTPTLTDPALRTAARGRERRGVVLDATLLAVAIGICFALLLDGGFEALIGAFIGFAVSARRGLTACLSGAFAGLFTGALFAGFFHQAVLFALSLVS
jgi:hypothetical protein